MIIHVAKDYDAMSQFAAQRVLEVLKTPRCLISLPGGGYAHGNV